MKKEELKQLIEWTNRLELACMDASNAIEEFLISGGRGELVRSFAVLKMLRDRPGEAIRQAYAEVKGA
jgi:hypothetical protein